MTPTDLLAEIDRRLAVCREADEPPWTSGTEYVARKLGDSNYETVCEMPYTLDDSLLSPEAMRWARNGNFIAASGTQRTGELEALKLAVCALDLCCDGPRSAVLSSVALGKIAARLEGRQP